MSKNTESFTCTICGTSPLDTLSFVNHILGKKHKRKANSRHLLDDAVNKRTIHITSFQSLSEIAEQILTKYLSYEVIDAVFNKTSAFIEFKAPENASRALKLKLDINGRNLRVNKVDPKKSKRYGQGNVVTLPPINLELQRWLKRPTQEKETDRLIMSLVHEIELKPQDYQLREEIRFFVESFLNPIFPQSRTFIFGSSANNLGFSGCDVDMVADLGFDVWAGRSKAEAEGEAERLTKFLAKEIRKRKLGYNVFPIGRARVPIVKFIDAVHGLQVDLSFKNGMPIYNTQLIRLYTKTHALVKPFLMLLRYWAKVQLITGGCLPNVLLSNYCFCMMMLFSLMVREDPIVPSVGELQNAFMQNPVIIDGCNCSFSEKVELWVKKYHTTTILNLALEFFEFYGHLDYKELVISPLAGTLIPKTDFTGRRSFVQRPHLKNFDKKSSALQLKVSLCVQDPFDLSHNISRGYNEEPLITFQLKCQKAASICKRIKEGNDSVGKLFMEYDLEDLRIKYQQSTVKDNAVDDVCEVISENSSDSVELVQELEAKETCEDVQTIEENAHTDNSVKSAGQGSVVSDDLDKENEKESTIHADEIISNLITVNNASTDDDIAILNEVRKKKNSESVDVVDLENNLNLLENSRTPVEEKCMSEIEIINTEESINSPKNEKTNLNSSESKNGEISSTSNDLISINADNTLSQSSVQEIQICYEGINNLGPNKEPYNMTFNFYSNNFFDVCSDGGIKLMKSNLSADNSKDKCITKLFIFIMKHIMKCDVLDVQPELVEFQIGNKINNISSKRKSTESGKFYTSAKFLKANDEQRKSIDCGFTLISKLKCRTRYKIWEGRKKLSKLLSQPVCSPLQTEVALSDMFEKEKDNEFSLDLETKLWKDETKPNLFWITVYSQNNKDRLFSHFWLFFTKFTKNLFTKIDDFIHLGC